MNSSEFLLYLFLYTLPIFFIYLFFYVLSIMLNKQAMKENAKKEMWEWFINIVIAIIVVTFIFNSQYVNAVFSSTFSSLSDIGWEGYYNNSLTPAQNLISFYESTSNSIFSSISNKLDVYADLNVEGTKTIFFSYFFGIPSKIIATSNSGFTARNSISPCSSLRIAYFTLGEFIARAYQFGIDFLNLKRLVEQLSRDGAIYMFLLLGFFLRAIHITRGIGGFLISFSIATVFFLPISYIFVDGVIKQYYSNFSSQYFSSQSYSNYPNFSSSYYYPNSSQPNYPNFSYPHHPNPSPPNNSNPSQQYYSNFSYSSIVGNVTSLFDFKVDCKVSSDPFSIKRKVWNALTTYLFDYVPVLYIVLILYSFAWLSYFSAMMGMMNVLGTSISPFLLNILLRV